MKQKFLTLTLALMAILSFSSCSSDDDYKTPTVMDLIGAWEMTYADKNIQVDGETKYFLDPNGKFTLEGKDCLDPENQTHVLYGTWSLAESGSQNILTISYKYEDPMTGEEITQTSSLSVTKFSGNQFRAVDRNGTELIFTRITKTILYDTDK